MSVEQAMLLAAMGGLAMYLWARWMTKGEEWPITAWVRWQWQRLVQKIKRRAGFKA